MEDISQSSHDSRRIVLKLKSRGDAIRCIRDRGLEPKKTPWRNPDVCEPNKNLERYSLESCINDMNCKLPFEHKVFHEFSKPVEWGPNDHPFKSEQALWRPDDSIIKTWESHQPAELESNVELYEVAKVHEFNDMMETLEKEDIIGFDIEERMTYCGSIVCVIQISVGPPFKTYLVNALSMRKELARLNVVTTNPSKLKLFHGGQNDLPHLQRCGGIYFNGVIDTQLLYQEITNEKGNIGYADLVAKYCNFRLDKDCTSEDWSLWPLKENMLRYAALDVLFLRECFFRLLSTLVPRPVDDVTKGFILNQSGIERIQRKCNIVARKLSTYTFKKRTISPGNEKAENKLIMGNKLTNENDKRLFVELFYWREIISLKQNWLPSLVVPNWFLVTLVQSRKFMQRVDSIINKFPNCTCQWIQCRHKRIPYFLGQEKLNELLLILLGKTSVSYENEFNNLCLKLEAKVKANRTSGVPCLPLSVAVQNKSKSNVDEKSNVSESSSSKSSITEGMPEEISALENPELMRRKRAAIENADSTPTKKQNTDSESCDYNTIFIQSPPELQDTAASQAPVPPLHCNTSLVIDAERQKSPPVQVVEYEALCTASCAPGVIGDSTILKEGALNSASDDGLNAGLDDNSNIDPTSDLVVLSDTYPDVLVPQIELTQVVLNAAGNTRLVMKGLLQLFFGDRPRDGYVVDAEAHPQYMEIRAAIRSYLQVSFGDSMVNEIRGYFSGIAFRERKRRKER